VPTAPPAADAARTLQRYGSSRAKGDHVVEGSAVSDVGIGTVLREARVEQGRGLDEAAAATSMRVGQIEALESDRFETFGGDVYAKGFLRTYARWLGLDPEPLLDRYRRYVEHGHTPVDARRIASSGGATSEESSDLPIWLVRLVAVAGVAALAIGLIQFVSARVPSPADEPTIADAPDPVEPSSSETDAEADPSPTPSPSPSPTFEGVELTLAFEDRSWISVTVDGQETQEGIFEQGAVLDLQGDDEVVVRFGNAGGVTALLNGQRIGPFGEPGDVTEVRFTQDGFDEI
jgi:cytoskeleton protein RodZ